MNFLWQGGKVLSYDQVPQEKTEVCMGSLLGIPVTGEGCRIGHKEELKGDVLTAKTSANPSGSSGATTGTRGCSELGKRARPWCPHINQLLGTGCSPEKERNLGEAFPFG